MVTMDELTSMKLHKIAVYGSYTVLRVPGGWIYTHKDERFGEGVGAQCTESSVFVPEELNVNTRPV